MLKKIKQKPRYKSMDITQKNYNKRINIPIFLHNRTSSEFRIIKKVGRNNFIFANKNHNQNVTFHNNMKNNIKNVTAAQSMNKFNKIQKSLPYIDRKNFKRQSGVEISKMDDFFTKLNSNYKANSNIL